MTPLELLPEVFEPEPPLPPEPCVPEEEPVAQEPDSEPESAASRARLLPVPPLLPEELKPPLLPRPASPPASSPDVSRSAAPPHAGIESARRTA